MRLERLLRERAAGASPAPTKPKPVIRRVTSEEPRPLSFGQERLWFLDQFDPGRSTYNIPTVLELSGELDRHALEWSIGEIVRRHEALRTTFGLIDGQPVQLIGAPGVVLIPLFDLTAFPDPILEADRLADAEALAPFDLARGPLFRVALQQLRANEHRLLVTMHHTVSDGWSLGVLLRELASLYEARITGAPAPAEPPIQYGDFAVWQREWMSGDHLDTQLAYWRKRLQGPLPILELPEDHPRPPVWTGRGGVVTLVLPAELGNALRSLARREGVTLFMTLLAGFKLLMARYADTEDIIVGFPIAERTRPETEAVIGFFVNTLVLRTDLSGDPRCATSCSECARWPWAPTLTRTFPSRDWWRSSGPSGARAAGRSSR